MTDASFDDLQSLAKHLREGLKTKDFFILYAFNNTGKTRLSFTFKELGKVVNTDGEITQRDTLYFNAFTEDLFNWDNDLTNDRERVLKINKNSHFFAGLEELEMENRIRLLLNRYADFEFKIDTDEWEISFAREIRKKKDDGSYETKREEDIKISRGEENIFVWCFFLAIAQLVLDGAESYKWVKFFYIDDPVSSLDENNAIAVANHLAQLLTKSDKGPKTVVSTHHPLFFNVLCNELKKKAHKCFLKSGGNPDSFALQDMTSIPFLHHLATLHDLNNLQKSGALYSHHFNMMRRVMEQTAHFFGMNDWKDCIRPEPDDPDSTLYKRVIDLMSHGDYSVYEPKEMMEENKVLFRRIFRQFINSHPFNPDLFSIETQ